MEPPTLLHTLNADIQGLLRERLLETTLTQLQSYPVYLLHHRIEGKVVEVSYICLVSDPVTSLFALIEHLVEACKAEYVGFVKAFGQNYDGFDSRLTKLWEKHPGLENTIEAMRQHVFRGDRELQMDDMLYYLLMPGVTQRRIAEGTITCSNMGTFFEIIKDGHELLKQHLDAEDLMAMLNLGGNYNSCSLIPLNQPHELKHY